MSNNQPTATATTSSAKTATGNSAAILTPQGANVLSVVALVTAVTGTSPTMTLSVEWSHDGVNFAQGDPADTFTAITAAGNRVKRFDVKGDWFRLVWTVGGTTPSFTFSATASGI